MEIENYTLQELKDGLQQDSAGGWRCIHCGESFVSGQVYPLEGRYYDAAHAAARHVQLAHPARLEELLALNSKYNGLTENQQQLLALFAAGLDDAAIAKQLDISPSTVRHHRFTFREKAKAAKLYLAQYELAEAARPAPAGSNIIPIHAHATMVDDRYVITEAERDKLLGQLFESQQPLRLKRFPPKEKKKVVILGRIAAEFEKERQYTEKEVNAVLKEIYDDYVTLRRYLISYGYMDRTRDGSAYWMK